MAAIRTSFAILLAAASLTACEGNDTKDASTDPLDAGSLDVVEGAERGDAEAETRPDAGGRDAYLYDVGGCTCEYGFHQQCGEDETCSRYNSGTPMCVASGEPSFGTAQCSSVLNGTPCKGVMSADGASAIMAFWFTEMRKAAANGGRISKEMLSPELVRNPEEQECVDFLGWTVTEIVSVCWGEGRVTPPQNPGLERNDFYNWHFNVASDDTCRLEAGARCVRAVGSAAVGLQVSLPHLDTIPEHCPDGLPYSELCGPDSNAQDCLRMKLRKVAVALVYDWTHL